MRLLRKCIRGLLKEVSLGADLLKREHGIDYTALVLDAASVQRLKQAAIEFGMNDGLDFKAKNGSPLPHHMTIINSKNQEMRLPGRWLDQKLCVKVVGFAQGAHVMAALVDLEGQPFPITGPAYPHVTIAVNHKEGGEPSMSNWKFKPVLGPAPDQFKPVTPIVICGRITEVFR